MHRDLTQFEKIRLRVNSRPGEPTFSPSYMYRDTFEDATFMIAKIDEMKEILYQISELSVPGIAISGLQHRIDDLLEKLGKSGR